MKKLFLFFVFLFSGALFSQNNLGYFKKDFIKSLDKNFNEEQLNNIFSKYSNLITHQSDITQLTSSLKGERISVFPLVDFKNESLYQDNINNLLNSENKYQRLFSYLLIGASNDLTKENILLQRLKTEKEGNLIWCGMSLLGMKTKHVTEMFDFLVENEDFGDAHMLPLYLKLDKDSLRKTSYKYCNSNNIKAKILAVQVLSQTGKDDKTEKVILEAIKNFEINYKGYAIYTAKELQIGNLLNILKPLLNDEKTKNISLEALANSPTKEDNVFLFNLIGDKGEVSDEILNALLESKNINSISKGFEILKSDRASKDYFFFNRNEFLESDELLPKVQDVILNTKNPKIVANLLRLLDNRSDDKSMDILINFLQNKNEDLRYWSASALQNKTSDKLKKILPNLISDEEIRTVALVKLLIQNKIDNLQPLFEKIYEENKNDDESDWQRASLEYLSQFPLDKDKIIFRKILENKDSDFALEYSSAEGLANLKDNDSIDLLVKKSEEKRKESDLNARVFLVALSKLKSEKSKKEIESFLNSEEEIVRELVSELLKNW